MFAVTLHHTHEQLARVDMEGGFIGIVHHAHELAVLAGHPGNGQRLGMGRKADAVTVAGFKHQSVSGDIIAPVVECDGGQGQLEAFLQYFRGRAGRNAFAA